MAHQLYRNTSLGNSLQGSLNELIYSLNTNRFCDNEWNFVLNDVEFRKVTELTKVDKVKIVATDGKDTGSNSTERIEKNGFLMTSSFIIYLFFEEKHSRDFINLFYHRRNDCTMLYILSELW
uniref:Transcription initiation factor IIA gamma chain n=1 Tax=Neovison vison TaxID=452646 RepID=A0A8C7AVP1_NEOVI